MAAPANDDSWRGSVDAASRDEGMQPPHDLNAEAGVLSAVMLDPKRIADVDFLLPLHFYSEAHRQIWRAMVDLRDAGTTVDVLTVQSRLRETNRLAQVGGAGYLTEVLDAAPVVANVRAYGKTVHDCWRAREVIVTAQRVAATGYAGVANVQTFADEAAKAFTGIGDAAAEARAPVEPWTARVLAAEPDWYTTAPPRRTWLLRDRRSPKSDGVLPLGKVGQLAAEGGAGKTMVLLQLAVAVATGGTWLGALDVASPGRVLVLLGEEDPEEARRRVYNAVRTSTSRAPDPGMLITMPLAGVPSDMVRADADGNTVDAPFLLWLRRYIASLSDLRLIIVDPLSRFAGADAEKDNAQATRFVSALESLSVQTGATVLVSHHTAQRARNGGAVGATASRGVTALVDGVRWAATMGVEHVDGLEGEARTNLGELVTVAFTKSNYSRKGAPIVLRRDLAHGGALVPLDETDAAIIAAAREATDPGARRAEERETVRQQREAREVERQAAANDHRSRRFVAEEAAILDVLKAQPGLGSVELRAQLAARLDGGCGREAMVTALARLGTRVRREPGPRNGQRHFVSEAP